MHTRKITELNWNRHKEALAAFKLDTTFVTSDQISAIISDPNKPEKRQLVDIKIVSLRWMFQDRRRFCDLVSQFKGLERPAWFGHELLAALFKTNWSKTRRKIILPGLVPFAVYFLASLLYTDYVSSCEYGRCQINLTSNIILSVGSVLMLLWSYFSYLEILQLVGAWKSLPQTKERTGCCQNVMLTLKKHYSRRWNYIDSYLMVQVPVIYLVSVLHHLEVAFLSQRILIWQTLGCQIAMWFKLFDWLRLYSVTAIYPILLREVLYDIYPFVIMMLIVLGLFGNGLQIFSTLAVYEGHVQLYARLLPFELLSAIMSNVLTMAGEYEQDRYYIRSKPGLTIVIWVWFACAILMTQVVFLNVLIAIISDTFDRVWEQH